MMFGAKNTKDKEGRHMEVSKLLSEILGDSEESKILEETYGLITQSVPTVISEAKTHMLLLDHARTKLSTIYYMVCREISRLNALVQPTYDAQYTRLVKLGRPTKDAIESEIRSINPEYSGTYRKMCDYEDLKNLITMYIRCIDSNKNTTVEILHNINRID